MGYVYTYIFSYGISKYPAGDSILFFLAPCQNVWVTCSVLRDVLNRFSPTRQFWKYIFSPFLAVIWDNYLFTYFYFLIFLDIYIANVFFSRLSIIKWYYDINFFFFLLSFRRKNINDCQKKISSYKICRNIEVHLKKKKKTLKLCLFFPRARHNILKYNFTSFKSTTRNL